MKKERIHLSDHFTFGKLIRFTLPMIMMMIFSSIYWIVDGFFISNYAGANEFAGVNLIFPVIMLVACVGFMFGSGGGALISKKLGEGKNEEANQTFSLITYITFGVGVVVSIIFYFLIDEITSGFAAINSANTTPEMIESATTYGKIMIAGISLFIMQGYFHSIFSVNETNLHGFFFTFAGGLLNMFLDYLLIGVFKMNVVGAAIASLSGMLIASVGPTLYFIFHKNNLIYLGKPRKSWSDLRKTLTNGSSEFVSNVSGNLVTLVLNIQLIKYIGQNGVVAYGIISYVSFLFFAIFIGYSVSIASPIGYNYGAKNNEELTNMLNRSFVLIEFVGLVMFIFSILLAGPFARLFTNNDPEMIALAIRAMRLYSICYLFTGFSMFGSSFFTGLNNGLISALISFCRTLVFELGFVFLIPLIFGVDGIWLSIVFAEVFSMIMTILFLYAYRKKYGYEILFFPTVYFIMLRRRKREE